jgi:phosphatidylserine/phosphatidylglycerophosphate/cardiolipin synthase-like enzyme
VGKRAGSILTSVLSLTSKAEDEIQATVYSFGENTLQYFSILEDLLKRGIKIQLIINRFHGQPYSARTRLKELGKKYRYLTIYDFEPKDKIEDLHAKIIVVDRRWALVGSSNISWHGYISNHELAILIDGDMASSIASMIDDLASCSESNHVMFHND